MPFIVAFSVPASVLFGILGSVFLSARARRLLLADNRTRTGLHEYVRYARWHTSMCIKVAGITGALLFVFACSMISGDVGEYALVAAVLAAGPLAAWALSMVVLARLIERRGARWTNLLLAAVLHVLLLAACIPLAMGVAALTGARL